MNPDIKRQGIEGAKLVLQELLDDPRLQGLTIGQGVLALRRGRSFVGIELNPEYIDLARKRIIDDAPLFNGQYGSASIPLPLDGQLPKSIFKEARREARQDYHRLNQAE